MSPLRMPILDLELEVSGSAYIRTLSVIEAMRDHEVGGHMLRLAERFRVPEGMSLIMGDHDGA